jgi:hypothetical protein
MCSRSNTKYLKTLSIDLLDNALKEITLHRKKTSPPNDENFITAEYLLLEAKEYIEGAWDMVSIGRYNASIALSRWILEASLNLFWAVAGKDEIQNKLKVLAGEALRCDANLREGLAEIWPSHAGVFKSSAEEARKVRKSLGIDKLPESLEKRLKDIKQEDNPNWKDLYPLYRICCSSAHPSLKVWERFAYSGNSIIGREPVDKYEVSSWMAAASALYLVMFSYCLTSLGDSQELKDWWENKVRPLLNED